MSVDIVELDLPSPNMIPDEVIPNLNMLRLEVWRPTVVVHNSYG